MYKILIVEDTRDIREEIYDILTLEGHTVFQAENGNVGYKIALKNVPNLIISDILMPELNGFEMFKKLKKNKKTENIPLIFLSAKGENKDIRSGMNAGAEDYLVKPINIDDLIKVVNNKLEKQQRIKKNLDNLIDENKFILKEAGRMAKIGFWTFDKQTNTTSWSKVIYKIFDIDPKQRIPKSTIVLNCLEEKSKQKLINATKNLLNKGVCYDIELQITNLKNKKCWIQEIGEPIYNDKKDIIGTRGVVRDITSLKNNQDELKLSNERYKSISLATNDAVWDWDLVTDNIYRNREGFNKVFGFDNTINLEEMQMDDYVHPDDKNRVQESLKKILKDPNQNNFCFEYSFLSPNGNILDIEDRGFILRSKNGVAKRIIGAATNVSKRNEFKNSLQDAYSNLQAVLESTADGILVVDNNGKVINYNNKFTELWQLPNNILEKKDDQILLNFVANQLLNPDKWMARVHEIYLEPNTNSIDIAVLKDGRTFERYSQPKLMNGVNKGRVWSFRDITERINADKEKQQLSALIETSREIISFGDLTGKPTFINKAGRHLLGIDADTDLSTLHFSDFFPEEEEPNLSKKKIESIFFQKGRWEKDTIVINLKTKEKIAVYMSAFVIKDNITGEAIGLGSVSMDISEREKIKNELISAKEEAEKLSDFKDQFLANMSHEIRTPMNGILGFSELLKSPNLSAEKQLEYIRVIEKSGHRMLNTINSIISISKIESGLMDVDISESSVNEIIEYIYTFFKLEVEAKGLKFLMKNQLTDNQSIIKTDREKIYAILINLVENAIKFTQVGIIEIGYIEKGEYLEFYVKDTGIGIDKEREMLIFERFIQSDISDSHSCDLSGLGLSISKAFVEMLGGKIRVESLKRKGSIFYFTVPYLSNVKALERNVVNAPIDIFCPISFENKNLKILIVEDDEVSDLLLSIRLKDLSRDIIHAKNGLEAIGFCRKNSDIDLILMDIKMPVMDGYEATQKIREFNKDVIIIGQTAHAFEGFRERAIEYGCNECLSKPLVIKDLLYLMKYYFIKK